MLIYCEILQSSIPESERGHPLIHTGPSLHWNPDAIAWTPEATSTNLIKVSWFCNCRVISILPAIVWLTIFCLYRGNLLVKFRRKGLDCCRCLDICGWMLAYGLVGSEYNAHPSQHTQQSQSHEDDSLKIYRNFVLVFHSKISKQSVQAPWRNSACAPFAEGTMSDWR